MLAAKEKTVSDGEVLSQAKTRVWGLPLENANGVGPHWPASSTLHWGWSPFYGGTASGQLDQRYYGVGTGRFNTPDPYQASGGPTVPVSWNRYLYTMGDPINGIDPRGRQTCFYVDGVLDSCEEDDDPSGGGSTYKPKTDPNSTYTQFGRDRAYLIHAGGMLLARTAVSPKCEGAMQALGVDFDTLAIASSEVNIQNGTSDSNSIASAYGSAALGASAQAQYDKTYASYLAAHSLQHLTISDYFAATGNTAAWTPTGGNTVFINPALLSTGNLTADQGLMLHEMLHEVYGQDDGDIMSKLAAYDPSAGINPSGASRQISTWLVTNCVTGKGNN